ncbi:transposase [Streptomyces sp. NPDC096040]|uniref:IS110 family transposase n=1 Tax=Streptomyces sp. NPDC096040 TaxID=3155541 RepID=UPI00331C8C15
MAVDLNHGGTALLIGLLTAHDQLSPTSPAWQCTGPRPPTGARETDAKDAFVIADQARIRRDLGVLRPGDEIAVDLRTLTTRRLAAHRPAVAAIVPIREGSSAARGDQDAATLPGTTRGSLQGRPGCDRGLLHWHHGRHRVGGMRCRSASRTSRISVTIAPR